MFPSSEKVIDSCHKIALVITCASFLDPFSAFFSAPKRLCADPMETLYRSILRRFDKFEIHDSEHSVSTGNDEKRFASLALSSI